MRYLSFAKDDITANPSPRQRINAFSNANRALHFQVDLLSNAFGIRHFPRDKRAGFPNKLEFCNKCGITTPNILKRLNKARNQVEHEYAIPTKTQAEDFIDIVELFLASTERIASRFPFEFSFIFSKKKSKSLPDIRAVLIPVGQGRLYLHYHPGNTRGLSRNPLHKWMMKHSIVYTPNDDPVYYEWIRFVVHNMQFF